eukprot:CAMPEP_0170565792 /NCGR_PEP_ID=MMETSP0211-20121228/79415_1 /TAXON_ID=311385 /ORGANISM="Pseudokeronopsis sp., Strain OXSARD2" /LENGTH=69 /DNA_ID=CAMNT_0010886763 /DNA_START=5959 /DNA_END=6168 /DNA_ORIENTATION=-
MREDSGERRSVDKENSLRNLEKEEEKGNISQLGKKKKVFKIDEVSQHLEDTQHVSSHKKKKNNEEKYGD